MIPEMDLSVSMSLEPRFRAENEIAQPPLTPVLADCAWLSTMPTAADPFIGIIQTVEWANASLAPDVAGLGWAYPMNNLILPRHGSRPNPVPTEWPPDQPLPGAINVSFFDGHGELVKLDRLWQLYWHRDYQPPAKRPGLP